ncbi:MAG TPA: helix-turn-helix domain-containing protein [Thermoanaerobaculia bacterium]|nr:helix-turn-helix domain-containing protein [Thermoanaerobaculia bacterium]
MLGDTVREARIRKGLTQQRLAKLAGVSRRHLAALEKGANVSVNILQRVAQVLELAEIQIGDLSLRSSDHERGVNMPLLTEKIREARAEAERAQEILARAEDLLQANAGGNSSGALGVLSTFPRMPVRRIEAPHGVNTDAVRERPDWHELQTSGEIRHGSPIDEGARETVAIPKSLVEKGEIVFRARGDNMRDQGIEDGDLLIVELRPRGRAATGELVIGRIGRHVFVGRWWQKHGQKALMSNGLSEVTIGRSTRSLKVMAAINQIVRP